MSVATTGNDLILRGGRVIDPSQDIDRITDVRFTNGMVAALGDKLAGGPDTEVRDVPWPEPRSRDESDPAPRNPTRPRLTRP